MLRRGLGPETLLSRQRQPRGRLRDRLPTQPLLERAGEVLTRPLADGFHSSNVLITTCRHRGVIGRFRPRRTRAIHDSASRVHAIFESLQRIAESLKPGAFPHEVALPFPEPPPQEALYG